MYTGGVLDVLVGFGHVTKSDLGGLEYMHTAPKKISTSLGDGVLYAPYTLESNAI